LYGLLERAAEWPGEFLGMRMQPKVYAWSAAFLLGFIPLGFVVDRFFPDHFVYVQVAGVLWFLVFSVGQFFLFKCPHCGRLATIRPSGVGSPGVGASCAYCGKEY
jgi:hypothetical protein